MKVLMAEDNPMILMELESFVAQLGHGVTTATSGYAAFDTLITSHGSGMYFDAVITDMQMPNGNGLELLQAMERLRHRPPCLLHSMVDTYPCRVGGKVHEFPLQEIGSMFASTWFHRKPVCLEPNDLKYIEQFLSEAATSPDHSFGRSPA